MVRKLSRRDIASYAAKQLIEGASQKEVARRVAAYLIESHRTSELRVIVRDIAARLARHGHLVGTLTSAHDLQASTVKEIEAYAKEKTGATAVSLDTVVDESVIGGVRLELPGYELDTTISHTLTKLKTRYKKA